VIVLRLHVRLLSRSTVAWAIGVSAALALVALGYADSYRTNVARDILQLQMERAQAFTTLYGPARAVNTPGGFLFWRMGSLVLWLASGWGLLTTTRLLRGEEEAGRAQLVLGGAVTASTLLRAQLGALMAGAAALGATTFATMLVITRDLAGSSLFGSSVTLAAAVFSAIGAVCAQLTVRRRDASVLGAIVLAVALVLRMVSDARPGFRWLSWTTPFGWYERVQPFSANDPIPLVLAVVVVVAGWSIAVWLRGRRDESATVLTRAQRPRAPRERAMVAGGRARPIGLAARSLGFSTLVWVLSAVTFGFIFGLLSGDLAAYTREDPGMATMMQRFGLGNLATAAGFVGLSYHYLALAVAVFAALTTVVVRDEEASGRAGLLLAHPYSRSRWLAERWVVAASALVLVATTCGVATWCGAALGGNDVSFVQALGGSTNCVPVGLLFLGVGFVVLAVRPGVALPVTMAAVVALYLLEIVGLLLQLPLSVLDLSPFYRTRIYPAYRADLTASVGMTVIGVLLALVASRLVARRDTLAA